MKPTIPALLPRIRSAIADRFRAGDTVRHLAWDYQCKPSEVEECIREALNRKRRRGKGAK